MEESATCRNCNVSMTLTEPTDICPTCGEIANWDFEAPEDRKRITGDHQHWPTEE